MNIREGYRSEQIRNQAFEEVLDDLNKLQGDVYGVIRQYGPCSNETIAEMLGKGIHEVCPRVLELRQLDLVEYAGFAYSVKSRRKVSLWKTKKSQTRMEF